MLLPICLFLFACLTLTLTLTFYWASCFKAAKPCKINLRVTNKYKTHPLKDDYDKKKIVIYWTRQ